MTMINLTTNRTVDMIIRALRASGLLADDSSADIIRNMPNNATESIMDNTAALLNYGTIGGGGGGGGTLSGDSVFSDTDFTVAIDANADPATPHTNYFRVAGGVSTLPVSDQDTELATISKTFEYPQPGTNYNELIVGPRPSLCASDAPAKVKVGYDLSEATHFGSWYGNDAICTNGDAGSWIYASETMEIGAKATMLFADVNGRSVRGAFVNMDTDARFVIGDVHPTNGPLYIEQEQGAGPGFINSYNVRGTYASGYQKVFFRHDSAATHDWLKVCVGGILDDAQMDPDDMNKAVFSVVMPDTDANPDPFNNAVYFKDMRDALGDAIAKPAIFTVNSFANTGLADGEKFHYMHVVNENPIGVVSTIFSMYGDTKFYAVGGCVVGSPDVAENLRSRDPGDSYENGTVMVIGEDGKIEPSSEVGSTAIAGVVPEDPGLLLGPRESEKYDTSAEVQIMDAKDIKERGRARTLTVSKEMASKVKDGDVITINKLQKVKVAGRAKIKDSNLIELEMGDSIRVLDTTTVDHGATHKNFTTVTVAGRIPVNCSAENGPITPRTFLVSGPNGRAVAGGDNPNPLAVLGKAIGTLLEGTGKVEALLAWK